MATAKQTKKARKVLGRGSGRRLLPGGKIDQDACHIGTIASMMEHGVLFSDFDSPADILATASWLEATARAFQRKWKRIKPMNWEQFERLPRRCGTPVPQ